MFNRTLFKSRTTAGLLAGLAFALLMAGTPASASSSASAKPYEIGVLPFVDKTDSGAENLPTALALKVAAQINKSHGMKARVLSLGNGVTPEDLDAKQAIEIGRAQGVDAVLLGTVLKASAKQSSQKSGNFSIGGFDVGGSVNSVKADVTLRGSLYDVTSGEKIDDFQAAGHVSKTGIDTDVGTGLGDFSTSNSFESSPIGKALIAATGNLAKHVAQNKPKMTHYAVATGGGASGGSVASGSGAGETPSASGGGTQPNLVATKIDFIPGEKTIFYDDFHDMPPGEPPPHWTVRGGMMQLRMGGGIRELYTTGGTDVNLTSPSFVIPTDFTFQLVCVCKGRSEWEFDDKDGNTLFNVEVEGAQDYGTISAIVTGPNNDTVGNSGDVKVVAGKPDELDLWAQQGRVRAYLNGKRFADVNNIKFGPMDHVYASSFSYRPTGIRSVRIAEAAPDPGLVLAKTGKFVTHGIYFDTDSAILKPASAGVIKEISTALYKHPDMKLEIDGYTDSTGNAAHNLDLSKRRAEAVRSVLVSQFGIDQSRLTAKGYGDAHPIASNDTAVGRAQNRRVEFVKQGAHTGGS